MTIERFAIAFLGLVFVCVFALTVHLSRKDRRR